jgi:dethiobiotin synthetase
MQTDPTTAGGRPADRPVSFDGLFVTGTDTGVGKTRVAEAILRWSVRRGLRSGAYKPVASGVSRSDGGGADDDPCRLWAAAGRPLTLAQVCPQVFAAAAAPEAAARAEGRRVDERLLRDGVVPWLVSVEWLVVEGAGGLYSPLAPETLSADLARAFRLPLVIVDSGRLGAVGRVLAALRAARADGLIVAAIVLSVVDPSATMASGSPASPGIVLAEAQRDLARRLNSGSIPGGAVPLQLLPHGADAFEPEVDWLQLAKAAARDSKGI